MESRNLAFHFCLPPFDTYQHFDNFAVRTLSGDYDVAPGEVTRQHLEKAKGDRLSLCFLVGRGQNWGSQRRTHPSPSEYRRIGSQCSWSLLQMR